MQKCFFLFQLVRVWDKSIFCVSIPALRQFTVQSFCMCLYLKSILQYTRNMFTLREF